MAEKRPRVPASRLFFALWPDDPLRESLRHSTRKAIRASGGRPVPPQNLHVTLAFLGSVADADRAGVAAAAVNVREPAFKFTLDELKVWPRAKTLVLAPGTASVELARLYSQLWDGLEEAGFAREARPFRPHVTLARKVATPGKMTLAAPIEWRADAFALVRSITDPAGAQYKVIRRWALLGESPQGPGR
jgi:2'-5' RNA ligase